MKIPYSALYMSFQIKPKIDGEIVWGISTLVITTVLKRKSRWISIAMPKPKIKEAMVTTIVNTTVRYSELEKLGDLSKSA